MIQHSFASPKGNWKSEHRSNDLPCGEQTLPTPFLKDDKVRR